MSTVIEDFFVSLGFKIDPAGEKRFNDAVTGATTKAILLSRALEEAAKGIVRAIVDIAAGFEQISYAASRTGTSVQNLKGLAYAVKQLGGSYDAAINSMEAFAKNLRMNPGYESMLKGMGVVTRDAKNQLVGVDKMLDGFLDKMEGKDFHVAARYAESLGIDEHTFRTMRDNRTELKAFEKQYADTAKRFGLDGGKAAENGKALSQAVRTLTSTATVAAEKFYSDLAPALTTIVRRFSDWIATHPEQINAILNAGVMIVTAFANVGVKLAESLEPVVKQFGDWTKAITGKDGTMEAMEAFATFIAGAWLAKVLAGFAGAGLGFTGLLRHLGIPVAIGAVAAGHGFQTPDQYRQRLEADPEAKRFDEERKQQGGSVKRWWKRNAPTWLGGDPAAAKTETRGADLGPAPVGLLDNIARAEGTYRTGYDTSLAHGRYLPEGKEQNLRGKTLREILDLGRYMRRQPGNPNSSALGRYQIVGSTLKDGAQALGLDLDTTKFDEATQDRLAHWIARKQGLQAWEGFKSHPLERARAAEALRRDDLSGGAALDRGGEPSKPAPQILKPESMGGFSPEKMSKLADTLNKYDFSRSRMGVPPLGGSANDYSSSVSNSNNRTFTNSPNVQVKIESSGDPSAMGSAVARALDNVNAMSMRNAQSAMR